MQLRKSQHCGNRAEAKRLDLFPCLFISSTVPTKNSESLSDVTPIKTEEGRMRAEQIEQEVKDCGGDVLQWDQLSLLPQVTKTNLYKPRGKIGLADHPAPCLCH